MTTNDQEIHFIKTNAEKIAKNLQRLTNTHIDLLEQN
jgi:hypothetical protein